MRTLLLLGGAALVGWYFLSKQPGALGFQLPGTPAPTPTPTPTPTATPTPSTNYNSLANILSRVQSNFGTQTFTRDQWNFNVNSVSGITMPAPGDVWGPVETNSYDPNEKLTLGQYWGPMAAYLAAHMGMSGLGRLYAQLQGGWLA